MLQLHKDFLTLVRLGIGHTTSAHLTDMDLHTIKDLAMRQGLLAVVLDGLEKQRLNGLQFNSLQEKILLAQWIGEVSQHYEQRYEQYLHAIADMAAFYNSHGYKMMVLKGYACSLDWPKPEHRPCGDIDIWQFGQQKEADNTLANEKGIKIDSGHHHHTVFYWQSFMVENHYDFINIHAHKESAELEKIFKDLGAFDVNSEKLKIKSEGCKHQWVEVNGEKVYLPSPCLHALFLVRHMISHFAGANISLRQVLDWAFLVEKHGKEIDWDWFWQKADEFHLREFMNVINAICIEDLGFESDIFQGVQFDPVLKAKVLDDILEPDFEHAEPKRLVSRLLFKYHRWRGNAWKHELCYSESRWTAFWMGIWAKLLKPESI